MDLVPAMVVFLAAVHVIALVLVSHRFYFCALCFELVFAATIVDQFSDYWICRFTGFIDWPLIVHLRGKKFSEVTTIHRLVDYDSDLMLRLSAFL